MSISTTRSRNWLTPIISEASPPTQLSQTWSPDNKWIAYTRQLPSGLHAVFVYSLDQGKTFQITDGMSDALYPSFDKNGKYLYFTASTDTGSLDRRSRHVERRAPRLAQRLCRRAEQG